MTTPNDCFPDPESMSTEEKIALIEALHVANHELIDQCREMAEAIASGYSSMIVLSEQMIKADKKRKSGKRRVSRGKNIYTISLKLDTIGRMGLGFLGLTHEDVLEAEKFADIVDQLQADPTFNPTTEEEG